ncbi:hypothetical protein FA10DRAFT_270107 [Acaromyces ingoldii]|uniref:VPS37 C-terminal domain-containing protein n=1 Tax=Acaromyces ingoldii TaxID=215250 RepID=A0A316YCC9_9BASI|nr:hypothetical protein FA10DRAFT_270107 [Acaromyces ingoldii]PWN86544.1 hypothetical protein FA10DRAFT_270107 [Acaromyces ingoldii]
MLATLGQSAARLHDRSESFASAFVEGLPLDVVAAGHAEVAGIAAGSGAGAGSGTGAGAGAAAGTSNGQEVDAAFVRQYRSMRTVYHKRNIMADRWAKGSVS